MTRPQTGLGFCEPLARHAVRGARAVRRGVRRGAPALGYLAPRHGAQILDRRLLQQPVELRRLRVLRSARAPRLPRAAVRVSQPSADAGRGPARGRRGVAAPVLLPRHGGRRARPLLQVPAGFGMGVAALAALREPLQRAWCVAEAHVAVSYGSVVQLTLSRRAEAAWRAAVAAGEVMHPWSCDRDGRFCGYLFRGHLWWGQGEVGRLVDVESAQTTIPEDHETLLDYGAARYGAESTRRPCSRSAASRRTRCCDSAARALVTCERTASRGLPGRERSVWASNPFILQN